MLLPRFQLDEPESVAEACALLRRYGEEASVYAGGTELLLAMKLRILRYARLINIKRIPGLASIALSNGRLTLGPFVTHRMIEHDATLRDQVPVLAAMARQIGNVRVRAAGTVGGNVCFAEPHSDPPTLLTALDAGFVLTGADGVREVAADEFFVGAYETARRHDELLTAIVVTPPPPGTRVAYHRFAVSERPVIAVAASVTPDQQGRVSRVRIVVGAVGVRPERARAGETVAGGLGPAELASALPRIAELAAAEVPVFADIHGAEDYKKHLVAVHVTRALREAAARGQ